MFEAIGWKRGRKLGRPRTLPDGTVPITLIGLLGRVRGHGGGGEAEERGGERGGGLGDEHGLAWGGFWVLFVGCVWVCVGVRVGGVSEEALSPVDDGVGARGRQGVIRQGPGVGQGEVEGVGSAWCCGVLAG